MEGKIQKTFVPVIQVVSSWALYYALLYGAIAADDLNACDQSSCDSLTGAAAAEATKLGIAMLRCCAAQAATAVLALLLACRRARSCRYLAFVALAFTTANHGMRARIHGLFLTADPWDPLHTVIIAITFLGILADLLGALVLILGPPDDE